MCGICGLITDNGAFNLSIDLIHNMNAKLYHRGPDSDGYYKNENVYMGMRRLSIIDVSGGDQPIFNEDKSIAIVFNGEIYNFHELKSELINLNHDFRTNSDTEVIVHAYEQWGDDCLIKLNGMFAFSLWDDNQNRLLVARDRMGQKPLYWHYSSEGLVWASEAKALLTIPWIESRINKLALHHYLTLQYTPDPLTIFEGIYQLPAAHKLVLEYGQEPKISRWWQLEFEPKLQIDDEETIEQARYILNSAVERHMISDVPLGAFLSGGIDSSIVVALMAEMSSYPVKTFSIGFEEDHYSEARYALQIADKFNTDHHEFIFRPDDLIKLIESVISSFDEPFADPASLPLIELARQTRKHVTVALSGDGGDETLAGYSRYMLDAILKPYASLPNWITQTLVPAAVSNLPEPGWMPEDRNPLIGIKRLEQFSSTTEKASIIRWGSYFNHNDKMSLYTDSWKDELSAIYTTEVISEAYDRAIAKNRLERTLFADQETYLSGDLLPKTDRMSMAHSLEARAPFLDTEWLEFTAKLPKRFKVRKLQLKWLLRNAFVDKIPPDILTRGKQGFSIPLGHWFRNELRDWSRDQLINNKNLSEVFNSEAVEKLLFEHDTGKINHGKKIWSLLIFSTWQRIYLNG